MIQVVERIGLILAFLSKHVQGVSLSEIEKSTTINKATSCNLLRSLIQIGYVEKCGVGIYRLGPVLRGLAYPQFIHDNFIELANEYSRKLSDATRESGLALVRNNDQMKVIARHIYDPNVVINSQMFMTCPIFSTAVGFVYMAFDTTLDVREIYQTHLQHRYKIFDEFIGVLEDIRSNGYHLIEIWDCRQAQALAAPVFRDGQIAFAICSVVPNSRFSARTRGQFIQIIKRLAVEATMKFNAYFELPLNTKNKPTEIADI